MSYTTAKYQAETLESQAPSPLGIAIIMALATGLLLALMAFQAATWRHDAQQAAALIHARALATAIGTIDVDSDEGVAQVQRLVEGLGQALPEIEEALVLERTRFIAHSEPSLAGTRLSHDNLAHKVLFDDARALQTALERNIEERQKYSDLTKNPYPISILRPDGDRVYVGVPVLVDGEMASMVAIKVQPKPFPIGSLAFQLSLATALLIILSIALSKMIPSASMGVMGLAYIVVIGGLTFTQVQETNDAWQQQLGEAAAQGYGVWHGVVTRTDQASPPASSLLARLNQDEFGNPRAYFQAAGPTLEGPGVIATSRGAVRIDGALKTETKWTWGALGAILGGMLIYTLLVFTRGTKTIAQVFSEHWYAYAYISPAVIGTALLVFGPFLFGIILGFYTRVYSAYEFVGLQNFIDILSDVRFTETKNFYRTLGVTIMWTAVNVSLHVSIGLGLALILKDKSLKFTPVYRTLLIIPWALPNYITALIWKGMFNKEYGAVNAFLVAVGMEPVSWFNSFWGAFSANLVTNVWLGFPFMMVISLGALQSIPGDLYEAADVDGANNWDKFRRITVPLLKPALFPAIILGIIWTFNQFNVIYLVSGGAPNGETDILITEAYRWAFEGRQQFGYAAAYSTIIFMILFSYTYVTNRITKSTEGAYE